MAQPFQLTAGAVEQVLRYHDSGTNPAYKPLVQVIEVKDVKPKEAGRSKRIKVQLSDGTHYVQGLLTGEAVDPSQQLLNAAIRVSSFVVQTLNSDPEKHAKLPLVVIIMQCDVVAQLGARVGTPVDIRRTAAGQAAIADGAVTQRQGQPMAAHQAAPQGSGQPAVHDAYAQQPAPSANPYAQPSYPQQQQQPMAPYGAPLGGASVYGAPQKKARAACEQPAMYGAPSGGTYHPPGQTPYGTGPMAMYGAPNAIAAQYQSHGATTRNANPMHYTPIKDVSTFINRFVIKGRCSSKGEKRYYNKNGKQGCVFNFDLVDDTGEIRCVAFSEVAEKFYDAVAEGRCYTLTKANARLMDQSKRRWNTTGHDCEIYMQLDTQLEEVPEDGAASQIPRVNLKPVKLAEIESLAAGTIIDVIGVVESCRDWTTIVRRDSSETKKRALVIKDDSGASIEVTVWGDKADSGAALQVFNAVTAGQSPVLAAKALKVGDFNGKTLGTTGGSTLLMDMDDVPGVADLRRWFQTGGAAVATQALSGAGKGGRADRRVALHTVKDEMLGSADQPAWVKAAATLVSIKMDNLAYPACQGDFEGRMCSKKMQAQDDGTYFCERCAQTGEPKWRYLLNLNLQDFSGDLQNVSVFGEAGEQVMNGMKAEEAREIELQGDDAQMQLQQSIIFRPRMFKIKCALDTFRDEPRVKYTMQSCEELDYASEGKALLSMMDDLSLGRPISALQAAPAARAPPTYGAMAGAPMGGFGAPQYGSPGAPRGFGSPGKQHGGGYMPGAGAHGGVMHAPSPYGAPAMPQQGFLPPQGGGTGYAQQPYGAPQQPYGAPLQPPQQQGAYAFL